MSDTKVIKTIATCKPTEFLKQTVKIRKAVESWLSATDILAIFKRQARIEEISADTTDEEKAEITARNTEKKRAQMKQNLYDIMDACFDANAEETVKLLALCCFIEPDKADDYKVSYYLNAVATILSDKDIIDFFVSLAQLGQMNTFGASKA